MSDPSPTLATLEMTSAARPTWSSALAGGGGLRDGSSAAPTLQQSAKDQHGHLKLKYRQPRPSPETHDTPLTTLNLINGDSDVEISDSDEEESLNHTQNRPDSDSFKSSDKHEADDDLTEDSEDELLRELEKIKKEREAERSAKEAKEAERSLSSAVLSGNPLLAQSSSLASTADSFQIKRRWDDDVVFKNQARDVQNRPVKRFINDTIRSDFHRRFLDKYIK